MSASRLIDTVSAAHDREGHTAAEIRGLNFEPAFAVGFGEARRSDSSNVMVAEAA